MNDKSSKTANYASPPCYAAELDPLYRDLAETDTATWRDVSRWRKAERERLQAQRAGLSAEQRASETRAVCDQLERLLEKHRVSILGAYWPIRLEPDLRAWLERQHRQGLVIALPVIVDADQPLVYSRWQPGATMRRGRWGIAEPAEDDPLAPQLVLAPVLGIDRQGYRLGNGGGYFDRSLALADPRPRAVGVGYSHSRIATIYPQPHDIPMDDVVTA